MHARAVPHFAARAFAAALVTLLAVACEHNSTGIAGSLATITVDRNPDTLAIGTSGQFTATGRDAHGTIVGIDPVWSVAANGGAINSTSGVFTAGMVLGTFPSTVVATVGSLFGTATATVIAGPAASLTLTPTPVTLAIGGSQQFVAVVKDAAGNILTTLPNWATTSGGLVSSTGMFTAGSTAGTFTNNVTASVGAISASATVTVSPNTLSSVSITPNPVVLGVGTTQQFTATGRDVNGNVIAFTANWAVVASGGAINATGLFTAGTVAGTFANTVRVCSTAACAAGSTSAFATVTVTAGALATITVTPDPVDVGTLASQQFTAVGKDAGGNIVPISPAATWSVAAGHSGGTINASGLYTAPAAVGPGFDTVKAVSGAIGGAARVNIRAPAGGGLVAISVTPNPANVVVGALAQFSATGFDATGLVIQTPGLTWAVVSGGGTIDVNGLFTAGAVTGIFPNTVRATSGTVSGYATVNVTSAAGAGPSLGAAATHGILAGSAVSCASAPGNIAADVSVWPGSAITGFPPCVITGQRNAATPYAQTAQGDLTSAYLALAAMPCGTTITSDLGGTTLAPGVYCSGSSVGVTGTVTLTGNATDVFVIRAPSTLTTAGSVVLAGTVQAKNVFWWVGSSATLGTGSAWQGNIVAFTSITLVNNVTLIGRALARNGAVTLGTNTSIILPP